MQIRYGGGRTNRGQRDTVRGVTVTSDAKIVIRAVGDGLSLYLVRLAPSGVRPMDERWSRDAIIAMQPDGKLVVAGILGNALVVARYMP